MATTKPTVRLKWKDPKTGDAQDRQVTLPVKIGRGPDNTIVLEHGLVSRHHARLDLQNGQVILIDVGSANGTVVTGSKIDRFTLKDKDQFHIGSTVFTVAISGGTPKATQQVCHNCGHTVDIRLYDCPWCGYSLTGAQKKTPGS